MKKLINYFNKLSLALVFCGACGGNSIPDADSLSLTSIADNGVSFNGVSFNGLSFNGVSFNGVSFNGLSFNGVSFNGVSFNGVSLNNSLLTGKRKDTGAAVAGQDFVGVTMQADLTDGNTATMRLDGIAFNPATSGTAVTGATDGFYTYTVSVQNDAGWAPICGTSNGIAVPAVPVPGRWDPVTGNHSDDSTSFTFACVNAAIGKCVTWGYQPWDTKQECGDFGCSNQPVVDWLQACTRLVRADYCGDGVPHTRNGTPINLWDTLGIQLQAPTTWNLEAEWAIDGAHCIKHTRWVNADPTRITTATDLDYVNANCRSRLAQNDRWNCGSYSDFPSKNGLWTSPTNRNLIRNQSALNQ